MRRSLSLILFLLAAFALSTAASSSAAQGTGTFAPGAVDFGSVQAGDLPASIPVTLTNSSPDTPITIDQNDVTFGDPNPNAFGTSNDNCAGTTVQPGASCDLKVTFDPNSAGSYSSTMSLSESSGTDTLSVSGTVIPAPQPAIGVNPNPFDFGNQKKGTTSGAQQFTIFNSGDAGSTLHISNVTIASGSDPAFEISNNGCNDSNAECSVSVTFSPGASGLLTGGLSITPSTGNPVVVPLKGTGTVPTASAPATAAFSTPVNTPVVVPVRLTNTGNASLDVKGVTLTGNGFTNPGSGNCGNAVLAPNAFCEAQIQFNPSSPGSYNGTLTFTDDDNSSPGSQQTVQLIGTVKVPGISANPTTVPFGTLVVGRISDGTAVTITNTGDANLHISNVKIGGLNAGAFVLRSDTCSDGPIAPNGGTCKATVRFAPAKAAGRTATLVFVNDAGPDQSIPLTGEGQRPPDGSHLRAAAGCSDASLSWHNPDAPMFKKEIVVRGRRHYPTSVNDGVIVKHSGPSVVDSGPTQFHTYRYTVFSRYGSYNGERVFYSAGMHAKIHTGRICKPRNGGLIGDLTPTVDWTGYTGARSYAFILQRSGKTIWVHYVKRSHFGIPQSWRYGGATRGLAHGSTYSFYLYAYTRHRPNGVTIGQTTWSER